MFPIHKFLILQIGHKHEYDSDIVTGFKFLQTSMIKQAFNQSFVDNSTEKSKICNELREDLRQEFTRNEFIYSVTALRIIECSERLLILDQEFDDIRDHDMIADKIRDQFATICVREIITYLDRKYLQFVTGF